MRQTRKSLYSAFTRAKQEVRVFTTAEQMRAALADEGDVPRRTLLALRLRSGAKKRTLGEGG